MYVNTNVSALNAQRQLLGSGVSLTKAFERLSSGLRINSAADDAAGLQISNRLTSQVGGLNQAIQNANDGISLAQVAEGAMEEITNALQRMRVLAVQAENGINSFADREALQKEVLALQKEIDRIATTTEFGGQKLLDGNYKSTFLVGANAGQTIDIDLTAYGAMNTGDLWVSEVDVTQTKSQSDGERIYVGSEFDGYSNSVFYNQNQHFDFVTPPTVYAGTPGTTVSGIVVRLNDGPWTKIPSYFTATGSREDFVNAFNNTFGRNVLHANSFGSVRVEEDATFQFAYEGLAATATEATAREQELFMLTGIWNLSGNTPYGSTDFNTSIIDRALEKVDSARAYLGAQQNRFQSTIRNLSNVSENVSAARSRIRDTDYARETAELTRSQILQQAATSLLGQANQRPQAALSLLS
ncbi:flagellin [Rheinheimera sp. F8]|uniref:flagellin n=1 Tax=Rheinheimera sp. F8 TaxID=1763998 RepID=UPI000AD09EEF|nr:flagellin [Rheinheimera sp. F8]